LAGFYGYASSDISLSVQDQIVLDSSYGNVVSVFSGGQTAIVWDSLYDNTTGYVNYYVNGVSFNGTNTVLSFLVTVPFTSQAVIGKVGDPFPPGADQAAGQSSHAEGGSTVTAGYYSHAEGDQTVAAGNYSHAEGNGTTASGLYSHAEGTAGNVASGTASHAEGGSTIASGYASHTEGYYTTAPGSYSHAEGTYTITVGDYSHAEGQGTIASGSYQHVGGTYNVRGNSMSLLVVGNGTGDADIDRSDVLRVNPGSIGDGRVEVTGSLAATMGLSGSLTQLVDGTSYLIAGSNITITSASNGAVTIDSTSSPGGSDTNVQYNSGGSFAGSNDFTYNGSTVYLTGSFSQGNSTISSGSYSHAEGANTITLGNYSHTEGIGTVAYAEYSHAEGQGTYVYGANAHAEGTNTIAGYLGFAFTNVTAGVITLNSSYGDVTSVFSGYNYILLNWTNGNDVPFEVSSVIFSSPNTIVTLVDTSITDPRGGTLGIRGSVTPTGADRVSAACHSEGYGTFAQGRYSHAEGFGSRTLAIGAHAEGRDTNALGIYSHAEGLQTIASGSHQHVGGKYNVRGNDFSLFVIGNGTSDADVDRSDVLRVNSGSIGDGRVEVTGSLAATTGLSGSLTQLVDGTSYLIAGSNITITSASNGSIVIDAAGGGGGAADDFFDSTTTGSIFSTGSLALVGSELSIDSPNDKGTDVFFYVSGSQGAKDTTDPGVSLFGGDVVISGTLHGGSPLKIGTSTQITGTLDVSGSFNVQGGTVFGGNVIEITGSLLMNGKASLMRVDEAFTQLTGAAGTISLDCQFGQIFYVSGSIVENFTASLLNLNLPVNKAASITLLLTQSSTAYIPNALSIAGSTKTIRWQGGSPPSGTANKLDVFSFSILSASAGAIAMGQYISFG